MKKTWIIALISILLLNSCIKKECKISGGVYEFQIPATLSPVRDTVYIGDTISIVSIFPKSVFEKHTEDYYTLEDFKFYPRTSISKIDTLPTVDGLNSFEYLAVAGMNYEPVTYSSGTTGLTGLYSYDGNSYMLEFRLVALESGLFYLEQALALYTAPEQDFEGKCRNLGNDGAVNLNAGDDNNIDMLQDSPDPHFSEWIAEKPEERFYRFGGYCFYVRPS